jgi:hypothetical protein
VATLIPALSSCLSRMTTGEKRFASRLEDKLEDDYLCWYDVSIGERTQHPDFVVFHPSRGLLVLEVKDWKLETIHSMDKQNASILTDHGIKHVLSPIEQARQYMFAVTNKLERDPQLVWPNGSLKGKPFFPYGHGVVLTNIRRQQFDGANMGEVLPSHLVICQDEMTESADMEAFQKRLWDMFPIKFKMKLTLTQIDRIRGTCFLKFASPPNRTCSQNPARSKLKSPTSSGSWTCNRNSSPAAWAKAIASFTAWPAQGRHSSSATAQSISPRYASALFSSFATTKRLPPSLPA